MATITSPANGSSIMCAVNVSGTCSGSFVTVSILDDNNVQINGGPVQTPCNNGKFSVQYNICGVHKGSEVYIQAVDSGGTHKVKVTLREDCPAC